jgi:hypothetical protein
MVYVNQIHPINYGVKKNRTFFGLLYSNTELTDVLKWFDTLDCRISIQRQPDKDMTLEKFLGLINRKSWIILQLASPTPKDIRCGVRLRDRDIGRFAFIEFPYTDGNFQIVSELYKKAFERNLEDEPVGKGLKEYYQQMRRDYPYL